MKIKFSLYVTFSSILCVACLSSTSEKAHDNISLKKENGIPYQPTLISGQLSPKVEEQSGIIWHNNKFWVNNDSDCAAELYAYDMKGKLKQTVLIGNAENLDWEDLAEDSLYFYIGDFGNNFGDRKNLKVLRIRKSEIENKERTKIDAEEISFEWADQEEFFPRKQKHNFDCEAFFSYGDSLYLFTKNWADLNTKMYVMPKSKGHHKLYPRAKFNTNLLVTGADINSNGKCVALVGYKDFRTYLILNYNYEGTNFLGGKRLRIDMNSLGGAQTEGIVFTDDDSLFITTEATKQPQSIYKVNWNQWIKIK